MGGATLLDLRLVLSASSELSFTKRHRQFHVGPTSQKKRSVLEGKLITKTTTPREDALSSGSGMKSLRFLSLPRLVIS